LKNELNSLIADSEELLNEKLRLDQAAVGIRKDNDLLAESAKNLEFDNDATRRKIDDLERYSQQLKTEESILKEKIMSY
jgi:phage shock protein A